MSTLEDLLFGNEAVPPGVKCPPALQRWLLENFRISSTGGSEEMLLSEWFTYVSALVAGNAKGADVAAAATVELGEGRFFHVTGSGGPVTAMRFEEPQDGRWALVVFDASPLLETSAGLVISGGDYQAAAGDMALLVQDTSTQRRLVPFRVNGKPVVMPTAAEVTSMAAGAITATTVQGAIDEIAAEAAFLTGAAFTGPVSVELTDAGASTGPTLSLWRDSATPAASDLLGSLRFTGMDSAADETLYAFLQAGIADPTNGSEDGFLDFGTVIAGAEATRLRIGAGLYHPSVTGGDKGNNTLNIGALYQNNVQVVSNTLAGLSLLGRASNTPGAMAAITAAADGHVLRRAGTSIDFGTIATAGIADEAVTNAKLRNSAAVSVIGRSANSSGVPADIAAGSNDQFMGRVANALGFFGITGAQISNTPSGAISATNAQAAINELDAEKAAVLGLKGYLFGCEIANNTTDATNDIDFAAGSCVDSTGAVLMLMPALTKRLDAGWAPGTGNGMRYSGAPIANATYHLYAVCKAGGADPDWFASGSADTATVLSVLQTEPGGSDYIYIRRVASIIRQSGAIRGFIQTGDVFQWAAAASDRNSTSAMSEGQLAVTVPSGIVVWPMLYNAFVGAASADVAVRIKNGDNSGPLVSIAASNGNPVFATPPPVFKTNTSAEIRYIAAIGAGSILLNTFGTYGYIDRRGRDA